jgi:hypothetical protein
MTVQAEFVAGGDYFLRDSRIPMGDFAYEINARF